MMAGRSIHCLIVTVLQEVVTDVRRFTAHVTAVCDCSLQAVTSNSNSTLNSLVVRSVCSPFKPSARGAACVTGR